MDATKRHIRVNGFNMDRRMRSASKRKCASDGRTFCGADGTPDDTSKDNALGALRIAQAKAALGMVHDTLDDLCEACLEKLSGK